ncbi:type 2 lanthipeptide synthetase LanM [Actinoplanes sp. NPDC023714]|uniref:type 2 lanthipeptide synthetase LanM n=1 Tax=Actinoplanes sp. NPDC023714 TaxID=3154322 RepID=UPI0033C93B63
MSGPSIAINAFRPFYDRVVPRDRVAARLREAVTAVAAPEHVDGILDRVWNDLAGRVEQQSFRTLIGAFHVFREARGLPATTTGDTGLRLFRDHLAGPGGEEVLAAHPVLRDRLSTMVTASLEPYAEVLGAYRRDREAMHRAGLLAGPDQRVVSLFGTAGDLHNDNRKVVGLELAGGGRVLFKPRDLATDDFVRDLYAAAEPYLTHSLRDCLPRSIARDGYGWQEYVTPRPMTAPDQPARYFYRFGALGAILGAIGASDLHDENVIAGGEHPYVIDTETVVRPDAGVDDDTLPHRLINSLKLSMASTMLLPVLNHGSDNDLNMSGIGVDGVQSSRMRRPTVRDHDNDGIAAQWTPITYRHGDNLPREGGAAVSAVAHFTDIRDGYLAALGAIRDGVLEPVLDKYPDMRVRCLIRSTRVYSKFIDAGTHPDYLRDHAEAERLLSLLGQYPTYLSPGAAAYVGEQERASLRAGNVPLFSARAGSTELATVRTAYPDVHRTSGLEFARRGLRQNARQPDHYHHFLLEEGLSEVAGAGELAPHSVFAPALRTATAGRWWPGIARTIGEVGVRHDGPDGEELGWLAGIGPGRDTLTLTPGNFVSFHDLGGIVTFLAHAAAADPALEAVRDSAERGLDVLLAEYAEVLFQVPEGAFTGAASVLLTRDGRAEPAWRERIAAGIAGRAAASTLEADLGNGPAGLLMLLLSRPGSAREVDVAGLVDLVHTHLTVARDRPWYDVAHGDLGLHWAAARAGRVLGDPAAATRSAGWLLDRLAGDDQPELAGWCNGAAGLLLAATEILAAAGRPDALGEARTAALLDAATHLSPGLPVDLSVCHGSSGVIQSLLATGRILGDDAAFLDRAAAYQERVIAAARAHGFSTGAAGRTALLGYLLGWSGVGDTDLLLDAARDGRLAGRSIPVAFHLPIHPAPQN